MRSSSTPRTSAGPWGSHTATPPETLRKVADFFKGSNALIGAKNRVAGLTLRATDQDWSNGSGPAVEGRRLPLVMAMTGRKEHVDDLTGEGVETLRTRCR